MKLMNPAGLWLLLGIPVLIVIYLIKAQHEDRAVSSTFIWKLSSRFMKKRQPLQKLRRIMLFILQLLIILTVSVLAARPAVISGQCCDYIAVVDASASMQTVDEEGVSRFSRALTQVDELVEKINDGHTLSVILAGDSAASVAERSTNVNEVRLALKVAACKTGGCNTEEALEKALEICQKSDNAKVIFYTDHEFPESENVEIVNVKGDEWNAYVDGLTVKLGREESVFSAIVYSNYEVSLTVGLRVDGELVDATKVVCTPDAGAPVEFTVKELSTYDSAEVFLEAEDALTLDNLYAVCRQKEKSYTIGLVSESPLYLRSVLSALGNCKVTEVSPEEAETLSGQDLYIFDNVEVEKYPSDGSLLVFGTAKLPEGVRADDPATVPALLALSADMQKALGMTFVDTMVNQYAPLRGSAAWQPFMLCGEEAVGMIRAKGGGRYAGVVGFDLHDSNLPLQTEFLVMMQELITYMIPGFLKGTDHLTEQVVTLTVLNDAKEIHVVQPDGSLLTPTAYKDQCNLTFTVPGVYTAMMTTMDFQGEYVDFFVHIPHGERLSDAEPALILELPTPEDVVLEDAFTEIWFYLALGILLIVLVEWGWYYREQY